MVDSSVNQSGRYKAYPEYKHSGVEWLGEIPSSWGVSVMKWCILNNDGGVWGNDPTGENDTIVLRSTEQTVDGKWKIDNPALRKLTPKEKRSAFLKENDLLLTKSSGSSAHIGKTTLVDKEIAELECCYSNFMQRLRVNNSLNPKLVWYLLNNSLIREQFDYLSSTTTGLANLNASIIAETILPICSRKEQNKVVDFLDYETAKIDTLIEKQQRLIELLTEKRQAVISHAVTKGLNPDVPMKDSGVEWLGEVPEHWEVSKLKYYSGIQGGYAFSSQSFSEQGVPVLKIANVYQNRLALERQPTYVSEKMVDLLPEFVVQSNDILMSLTGTLGKRDYGFAVKVESEGKYLLNQRVAKLNPIDSKVNRDFLVNTLWSESYLNQLYSLPSGTKQANLSNSDVLNIWIAIPPTKVEQEEIANRLAQEKNIFDQLVLKAKQAIQLMQERRTALISAAITGKIDVRDWVKPE